VQNNQYEMEDETPNLVEVVGKPSMSQNELKKLAELQRLKREEKKRKKKEQ